METFAGFATHTDEQVGRLVDALTSMGEMDNTLFVYIVGDNGASAEGGPEGAYNEMMALNGIISTAKINTPHLANWGDPSTFPHYAIGWAWAGDTPFQWTKQIASHYGGTTNGMVVHWPSRIKAQGRVPLAVHLCDGHRPDGHGSHRAAVSEQRQRRGAASLRRHVDGLQLR
jgi:arylsulfatase